MSWLQSLRSESEVRMPGVPRPPIRESRRGERIWCQAGFSLAGCSYRVNHSYLRLRRNHHRLHQYKLFPSAGASPPDCASGTNYGRSCRGWQHSHDPFSPASRGAKHHRSWAGVCGRRSVGTCGKHHGTLESQFAFAFGVVFLPTYAGFPLNPCRVLCRWEQQLSRASGDCFHPESGGEAVSFSIDRLELRNGQMLWDDQILPMDFDTRRRFRL